MRLYSYRSDLTAWGAESEDDSEKTHINATVGLACVHKWKKTNGHDLFVMVMQVKDIEMKMDKKSSKDGVTIALLC